MRLYVWSWKYLNISKLNVTQKRWDSFFTLFDLGTALFGEPICEKSNFLLQENILFCSCSTTFSQVNLFFPLKQVQHLKNVTSCHSFENDLSFGSFLLASDKLPLLVMKWRKVETYLELPPWQMTADTLSGKDRPEGTMYRGFANPS